MSVCYEPPFALTTRCHECMCCRLHGRGKMLAIDCQQNHSSYMSMSVQKLGNGGV